MVELPHLLVCGGRSFSDEDMLWRKLDIYTADLGAKIVVVTGACPRGADAMAERWASKHWHTIKRFHAAWEDGPKAGPIRNQEMVDFLLTQVLRFAVAFHDGKSAGTGDCVRRVRAANIPLKYVRY